MKCFNAALLEDAALTPIGDFISTATILETLMSAINCNKVLA